MQRIFKLFQRDRGLDLLNILIPDEKERLDGTFSLYFLLSEVNPIKIPTKKLTNKLRDNNGIILYKNKLYYFNNSIKQLSLIEKKPENHKNYLELIELILSKKRSAEPHDFELISKVTGMNYLVKKTNTLAAIQFCRENKNKSFNMFATKKMEDGRLFELLSFCLQEPGQEFKELLRELLSNQIIKNNLLAQQKKIYPYLVNEKYHHRDILLNFLEENTTVKTVSVDKVFFDISAQPKENFSKHFDTFPWEDVWRLFVDAKLQRKENGWLDFELREPGYVKGMLEGFQLIINSLDKELSLDLLKNIHAICSNQVRNLEQNCQPGYFRDNKPIGFDLCCLTTNGLIELLNDKGKTYTIVNATHLDEYLRLESVVAPVNEIEEKIDLVIRNYNKKIIDINDADEKLNCIIELIVNLERIHPFGDANCRTFCMLLLNRELLRHGFSPVILEDPNYFDGYSMNELKNEIIAGMKLFQQVKKGEYNLGLTNYEIDLLLERSKKDFDENIYVKCKEGKFSLYEFVIKQSAKKTLKSPSYRI